MQTTDSPIYTGELNGTPLGDFRLAASDFGLVAVEWAESQPEFDSYLARLKRPIQPNVRRIAPYAKELREYLNGKRTAFTIPIDWTSFTPFQCEALQAVFRIPYGETRTYIDIAQRDQSSQCLSRRGRGECHEPHAAGDSLSPPDRRGWQTPRLRRRRGIAYKGMVIEDGRCGDGMIRYTHE